MKYECVLCEYVLVHTSTYFYPRSTPSTYLVRTIFLEYILGTCWYVLCLQNYSRECCCMSYACGKRYCECVACMRWCSNTKSVPLLVSNIHDIILVRTKYVLVCTSLYYYTCPVSVRTGTYRYVLVRTKYPVPVIRFTIPAALSYTAGHQQGPS